jgi:hypothetical protein
VAGQSGRRNPAENFTSDLAQSLHWLLSENSRMTVLFHSSARRSGACIQQAWQRCGGLDAVTVSVGNKQTGPGRQH